MTYEQMVAIIRTDDAEKLDELRAYVKDKPKIAGLYFNALCEVINEFFVEAQGGGT